MHIYNPINLLIYFLLKHAAAWYKGNLKELVDEAMEDGTDLPHSDAYTINGEPGDFCDCSNGMSFTSYIDLAARSSREADQSNIYLVEFEFEFRDCNN